MMDSKVFLNGRITAQWQSSALSTNPDVSEKPDFEVRSGLTFNQAIELVNHFDWQTELDRFNQGEGTCGLVLYKADSPDDLMTFRIFPLDVNVFTVDLTVENKSRRRGFWDSATVSVDLDVCSASELEKKLLPLRQYSIPRLYDRYNSQHKIAGVIGNYFACFLMLLLIGSLVGLMMEDWVEPLVSPTFAKWFWPYLLYPGGLLSASFLCFSRVRQAIKKSRWRQRLVIGAGFVLFGPLIVFMVGEGFMTPIHLLIASPATQIEQVSSVSSGWQSYGRGSCNGKVWVRSPADPSEERLLCDVPKAIWSHIRPGDTLLLEGRRSPIAFTTKKVSIISGGKNAPAHIHR